MQYRISQLAEAAGLSRSTLLYYEKKGLISGQRADNGYRLYTEADRQRLHLLQQLQAGGLTLEECKACLEAQIDRQQLARRLKQLDQELEQKQQARQLLAALLGEHSLREWHQTTDRLAPDAHLDWLKQQGFTEKQALHLKWLSKDMNAHDSYMADFMAVFQALDYWGPGSDTDRKKALDLLPYTPKQVLDIGCGKGYASSLIAAQTGARVIATDNEPAALEQLQQRLKQQGLEQKVSTLCASMTELPFAAQSFDLIWAEASAYIMGVGKALQQWQPLLQPEGYLVFSDLVWLTDSPSPKACAFWQQEYPDMQRAEQRLQQIKDSGFILQDHFSLSPEAWQNYYHPLKARVAELADTLPDSAALADIRHEIRIYDDFMEEFGYQVFVLKKR